MCYLKRNTRQSLLDVKIYSVTYIKTLILVADCRLLTLTERPENIWLTYRSITRSDKYNEKCWQVRVLCLPRCWLILSASHVWKCTILSKKPWISRGWFISIFRKLTQKYDVLYTFSTIKLVPVLTLKDSITLMLFPLQQVPSVFPQIVCCSCFQNDLYFPPMNTIT